MTEEYLRSRPLQATLPRWLTYRRFKLTCWLYYRRWGGQSRKGLGNERNTLVRNFGKHPKTHSHMREDRNGEFKPLTKPKIRRISVYLSTSPELWCCHRWWMQNLKVRSCCDVCIIAVTWFVKRRLQVRVTSQTLGVHCAWPSLPAGLRRWW